MKVPKSISIIHDSAAQLRKLGFEASANYGDHPMALAEGFYIHFARKPGRLSFAARNKVGKLLKQFYSQAGIVDIEQQLILKRLGRWGAFLIINHSSDILDLLNKKQRKAQLAKNATEFERFTKFISQK